MYKGEDTIYVKKVSPLDLRFANRETVISSSGIETVRIPVPDNVVLCNGCNKNLHSGENSNEEPTGYLVYLDKQQLLQDRPYDVFCLKCLKRYFPKYRLVEGKEKSIG